MSRAAVRRLDKARAKREMRVRARPLLPACLRPPECARCGVEMMKAARYAEEHALPAESVAPARAVCAVCGETDVVLPGLGERLRLSRCPSCASPSAWTAEHDGVECCPRCHPRLQEFARLVAEQLARAYAAARAGAQNMQ